MKAQYADNPSKGPGHGILRIGEPGALAMQDSLTFSIRRASDQQCIGASDRQSAEVFLTPDGRDMDGETLCLLVGPAVVDSLDVQETYRITLLGADGTRAACGLAVPQVTYSPAAGGAGIGKTAAPTPPPPPPPPPPAPAPMPELTPISLVCKVTRAGGRSAVKLSDTVEKATGDRAEIDRYLRVFGEAGRGRQAVTV